MNEHNNEWDRHWHRFATSIKLNPAQNYRYKIIIRHILENVDDLNQIRILDVGSGQGSLLEMINNKIESAQLIGFELSPTGIDIAKGLVPQAEFFQVDMTNPPLMVSHLHSWANIVCCSEVLEHVDEPVKFLKNIHLFLAPEGKLILTVPSGPMSYFDKHIGHRQHFSRKDLVQLLSVSGFKDIDVYNAGFPFHNLYRLVVIMRGKKLIEDNDERNHQPKQLANLFMKLFQILFKYNISRSTFGWQLIGIARKQ